MNSNRRSSTPKSLGKSQSGSKTKDKRNPSPAAKQSIKHKQKTENSKTMMSMMKKPSQTILKKKIEGLKPPQILIKVNYKNKRISIPINVCDERGLNDTVMPHIIRFEKEVLRNEDFNPASIVNWKTSGRPDVLKDYYFQTSKPIKVFKDKLLEIQPIWREKRTDQIKLQDFEIIKCIGTGGFSRVFLARLKTTGVFYALKLMEKDSLFQTGKECVVSNERNIMVGLKSQHIVNLQFAFETKHFVALALQYCPGGELFFYLRKIRKMSEQQARYCFIQILLGIQYLHSQNIIYRDIKPENIMIDVNGHLKIADFGLSKEGLRPNELATTYCGSPQYMAPEMLSKSGHSFAVDYYCMGALLYELVTGNPPFYSRDVEKIYHSIQNQQIGFPSHVQLSPEIKMLLQGLLIKDPRRRLGSMGGIKEILGHPWVRKLKPADIINKTVSTPIQIDLLTFNINEEEVEEGGEIFDHKFADEDDDFSNEFQDFYFNRYEEMNIVDEAFPSVKSQSTKENKSLQIQHSKEQNRKTAVQNVKEKKINGYMSSPPRQNQGFTIKIDKQHPYPPSELHRAKPNHKKTLKKEKSKKQLNLIERSKRNAQKSIVRAVDKSGGKGLKRVKSSVGLLTMLKKHK